MNETTGVAGGMLAFARPKVEHAWDRFDGMWAVVFYVTLGIPTASALFGDATTGTRLVVVTSVAAVATARELAVRWVAREVTGGTSTRFAEGGHRHMLVGLAWAAVTLAGLVALVHVDDVYFFALYGLFPQSFVVLPRNWAIVFAGALTPVVLVAQEGTAAFDDTGFVTSAVGSGLVSLALGVFIHGISRESEQRHDAILSLEAAQAEAESLLAASLAVSRARTPEEVLAAVGSRLVDHEVEALVLWSGAAPAELLASWPAGAEPDGDVTLSLPQAGAAEGAVLSAATATGADLSPSARRLLETLAVSCGLALANLQLAEAARQTGVAEERARLAREIHDTMAQGFVSVLTQLEAADDGSSPAIPDQVAERLSRARSIARSSLGEARRSVQALRPVELDSAPLSEAVERVARRWALASGATATVTVTGTTVALPPATEVTLLRAAQEALANVARHAGATSVNVTLSFLVDAVVLDVDDDGRGFDPAAMTVDGEGGFGLVALRQRVSVTGGAVGIESAPGKGTTVTVRLPVEPLERTGDRR